MPHNNTSRALLAVMALLLPLSACGQSAADKSSDSGKDTLVFAAVPAETSTSLKSTFEPLVKLLEKETGNKVEFQDATDYAAVIEGQRAGKIDIASYGPFSYKIAKDGGVPITPAVAPVNTKGDKPNYTSLAYVKKGSAIRSLDDVRGKKVCFVEAASTSGYLVPLEALLSKKIDPKTGIKPIYAGAHDASLLSVNSGQCDVGFAHDAMLTTLTGKKQIADGALTPIWESEPIPEDPIAINTKTVDAETVTKITTALQTKANKPALVEAGICASEKECVLPEEIGYGYVAVTDADYDPIRKICEVTKAEACNG
ncbi:MULTISPECIES: phosphate/phosphite/phosphonate ABC transporter substrate-binding protein [unclassified Luteococcus]|uniref:phosphate/phosphite/phosphonate ABC transporter substrate-binding protein n=1 Tax=unclassified Luteococcus TaxID=2639923 RepID=UPI00313B7955